MEPALSSDDSCDSEMKLMKNELIGNRNLNVAIDNI